MAAELYLIPCPIAEDALETLSPSILDGIKQCEVFFVENERSARRFFKKLWREMVIDNYEWHVVQDTDAGQAFRRCVQQGKKIGLVSEAGCPGVADPGQNLIAMAQETGVRVRPLTGPSSILLALMASGMNGQQFTFRGYLPIDNAARIKAIRELESESSGGKSTQIFIETPYRNNQLLQAILGTCRPQTRLCIAVDITGREESIHTRTVAEWKKVVPDLHKKTAIFLIAAF